MKVKGRGTAQNPVNRFERLEFQPDEPVDGSPRTQLLKDTSRSVLAWNQSPDVGFDVSVNPYRGCEHGCIYCYARPTHEYLGFSAGLDFETRILVKQEAPRLLRQQLRSRSWSPQPVALSGVTDPYQPAERELELTRSCLEVLCEFRNPVVIVTKSFLVTRDIDLLSRLARHKAVMVNLSVTSLDHRLQRDLEPRAASPARRLEAISRLSEAGIPTRVMVAPVIPGLTDYEIPAILEAAAAAGAVGASYVLLRLPHGVKELFQDWLSAHRPERKERVLSRLREARGGRLYEASFHDRMRGEGKYAGQIDQLFRLARQKAGLDGEAEPLSTAAFRVPGRGVQTSLF